MKKLMPIEVQPQAIMCRFVPAYQGNLAAVFIEGQSRPYLPYEKVRDLTVKGCERVEFAGYRFYTINYEAVIDRGSLLKIRVFEVVLAQNETLFTVRSEVIDQIGLRGDRAGNSLRRQLSREWGVSEMNQLPMLKLMSAGEVTYVKLNPRNTWFEDVFE
jgi:hypothetical protein